MPGLETVLFADDLRENLLSVGRLTDAGSTVVFNACGVKIYKNRGLRVVGNEIHYEARDSQGLYPLSLRHHQLCKRRARNLKKCVRT